MKLQNLILVLGCTISALCTVSAAARPTDGASLLAAAWTLAETSFQQDTLAPSGGAFQADVSASAGVRCVAQDALLRGRDTLSGAAAAPAPAASPSPATAPPDTAMLKKAVVLRDTLPAAGDTLPKAAGDTLPAVRDTLPCLADTLCAVGDTLVPLTGWAKFRAGVDRMTTTKAYKMTYVAVPLIVIGSVINGERNHFKDLRNAYIPNFRHHYDDYLKYAPAAAMLGLKIAGVEGRSSWGRMLVSDAFSGLLTFGLVTTLKKTVGQTRPDGADNHSFPSGHTATAFMAATMLHKEYGLTRSPWYSIGGYTVATVTALSRQMNNKHWLSDVLVGAGIGILSTELGYYFADLIFKDRGIKRSERDFSAFDYNRKSSFFSLYVGFNWLNRQPPSLPGVSLRVGTGATVGIEGAWFFNRYMGVGGRLTLASLPISMDNDLYFDSHPGFTDRLDRVEISPVNMSEVMAGPYFSFPLSNRWLVGTKLLAGYYHMRRSEITAVMNPEAYVEGARPVGMPSLGAARPQERGMMQSGRSITSEQPTDEPGQTRQPMVALSEAGNVGFGTGLSLTYVVERNFGVRLFYDCNFSPTNMKVTAYGADGSSNASRVKYNCFSSTLGAAVSILFW